MATASFDYNNYYKVRTNTGFDIYNALTNQKYNYEELLPSFQAGLNADFIKEKALSTQQPTPVSGTEMKPGESVTSPEGVTQTLVAEGIGQPAPVQQPVQPAQPVKPAQPAPEVAEKAEPLTTYTPPQFTNNNNQVYKVWNPTLENPDGTVGGYDVFKNDGTPIELDDFINMGLNIDHINTRERLMEKGVSAEPPPEPKSDFAEDYARNIKESGALSIKSQAEDYTKQLGEIQNKLNDEVADVNDNPWLAEGVRKLKIEKLNEKYEGKIKILTTQISLFNNLYEQALAEARFLTTGEQKDRETMMDLAAEQAKLERDIAQNSFENDLKLANLDMDMQKLALDKWKASQDIGETSGSFDDVMQLALNAGATPEQAVREAIDTAQKYGVDVNSKLADTWLSRAKTMIPVVAPEVAEEPVEPGFVSRAWDDVSGFFSKLFSF